MSKSDNKKQTANDVTDVKDIKNSLLYTKSNSAIGYLRLLTTNIDLLSENEKESITNLLTAQFKSLKEPFTLLSIPRTIDMELYLNHLSDVYDQEVENPYRKMILSEMITQASKSIMNGKNYEHQFFIKVWAKVSENVANTEINIESSLNEMSYRYGTVQNETYILDDTEIIKLCNLFGNSNTAVLETYDTSNSYTPIPRIRKGAIDEN